MCFQPRIFGLGRWGAVLVFAFGVALGADGHTASVDESSDPSARAPEDTVDAPGSSDTTPPLVSDETTPFIHPVVQHPFDDDSTLIEDFTELMRSAPTIPTIMRLSLDDDTCACRHLYPAWGVAEANPTASAFIESPTDRPLKIKSHTTHSFEASGGFDPGIRVPGNWAFGRTVKEETTWTWHGATGDGSSASQKFTGQGDKTVSVTCTGSVEYEYDLTRTCERCGHTDTDTRVVAAGKSASDSMDVKVFTLVLEIKPQSGDGDWGTSATIGAGGIGSAPHRADVRASLDPPDSEASFSFEVAWKPKDGEWGTPWTVAANGGVVHTVTSSSLIGDGGTLGGREEGHTSSVSANYAWAFDPAPTLAPKTDGSLEGSVGVKNGTTALDGHLIQVIPVSVTVQRWDDAEKKLVVETRTENLPSTMSATTGTDGLARLLPPSSGERILSATFTIQDSSVLQKVTTPDDPE